MHRLIAALLVAAIAQACLAAPPSQPIAASVAERMQRRFDQHPVLRAEFTQEKQMAAFRKPLVSRGRLVLSRGEGMAWRIDSPLRLTYVMTESRILEIDEAGKLSVRSSRDVPGIEQVGRIFRALISANFDVLGNTFTIHQEGEPNAWRVTLVPRPGPIAQFMRQIRLSGGRHVDRVSIEEVSGDLTTISFRSFAEDDALAVDERAWFGASR